MQRRIRIHYHHHPPGRPSRIAAVLSDHPDLHHSVPGAEARRFLAREICRNLCWFH